MKDLICLSEGCSRSRSESFDPDVRERLQRLAARRRRAPHWLMREAIGRYVDREEARDAFLRRGEEAWRHWRETGLHLTGQEVQDWLGTWGSQDEADPPACHE